MTISRIERKEKIMRYRRKFLAKALLLVVVFAVAGLIVMQLWNWVIPGLIVDAHLIDYPRAIGLLVLCRILFGGFRGYGGHGACRGGRWQHWQRMTPEERDKIRSGMASMSGERSAP
jgi:hypothetical protein